ncbi:STAS domain-containing protein [Piscinibacter sakaiensis]|uniref:STAS domain-containing protein n=1 Tax=Piscinibacter sakaiensis TaxID=1547922 RepID=UPI003AAC34C2
MARLPAKLTHAEAPEVARAMTKALRGESAPAASGPWAVDASELRLFDSSALAVLLECRRVAQSLGRTIRVDHPPAKLGQLAGLYGLAELLEMSERAPAVSAE